MMSSAYPLAWPEGWKRTPSGRRKAGRFSSHGKDISLEVAVQRVWMELEKLGVKNPRDDSVVSTNLVLNMSGFPRGDQGEPADTGVAIYWEAPGKPRHVIAVDAYTRVRDNIAAIAATLEAMRAIERHGGATVLERAFTGFTALPAPGSKPWWQVLNVAAYAQRHEIEEAFKRLARERHPDHGGSDAMMAELNAARAEGLRACQ